tara:strand:+ start:520 stop:1179 length:660 start_codon:yes stop_codon:yes gene_type:complete
MIKNIYRNKLAVKFKESFELAYWKMTKKRDKLFGNDHYEYFYTEYFGLDKSFYEAKGVLDIGCGPRGSLEWANMTKERIGLDPLANAYMKLGASNHQMRYVADYVENMPFNDDYFDVVCSFNSLDHVGDLEQSCREIKRVIKPGGLFLLIVDIHNYPTPTEPQSLKWDFLETYFSEFEKVDVKRLKRKGSGKIYSNLKRAEILKDSEFGNGILSAILKK